MRGDSVRDFYAKTLALLGLGMLAGTGALVDYWPAGVDVPSTGHPREQLAIARPLRSAEFDVAGPGTFERTIVDRADNRGAPSSGLRAAFRSARGPAPSQTVLVALPVTPALPVESAPAALLEEPSPSVPIRPLR